LAFAFRFSQLCTVPQALSPDLQRGHRPPILERAAGAVPACRSDRRQVLDIALLAGAPFRFAAVNVQFDVQTGLFVTGADGTYFWAYLWSSGDPFNDLDGGARDWSPVARDVDGLVYASIGWEGYREGIDDLRYIHTALRLAKEKGRKDVLDEIAKLQGSIQPGRESEESRRTSGLDEFFIKKLDNASELDGYRAKVVSMIMSMLDVPGQPQ
jgi:hypothetical protein